MKLLAAAFILAGIVVFILISSPSSEAVGVSAPPPLQSMGQYTVMAYCPCEKCCGKWSDGRTANNYLLKDGDLIIAAPPEISFGTKLYIPGYGEGRVEDRGGSVKGKRLDVYFDTHQDALDWGVKEVEVYLVIERTE
jgi:3D (Asp-Asp-Asp) domain-containing protein